MLTSTKLAALALAATMSVGPLAMAVNGRDADIQARLAAQLQQKSEFKDVHPSVSDGVVTLAGTVDSYKHKLDAEKKARKQDHVSAVRDELAVAGPQLSDAELKTVLAKKLAYNRVGFGNVWDLFTLNVSNGVATLGGAVRNPVDRDYAIAEVENTKGVRGVVENIKILPTSIFDDNLRVRTARAIYGDSVLGRYGSDPQAPIRIVVDNGHVALYGVVENEMDRNLAGIRANEVAGAFSVENHLVTDKSLSR